MHLKLDQQGPLYRQVTRALKAAIVDGTIATGMRLPSSRDLAAELGVGRNTVKNAFEQLIAEGYLASTIGSGTYALPVQRSRPAPSTRTVQSEPPSAYARRARLELRGGVGRIHDGVRYNFQYGNPIHEPASIDAWRRELAHAASTTVPAYPPTLGLPALRSAVADYLRRRRGVACVDDDILIVSGIQQALALTARVLVDPQDRVLIEEPHYFGARQIMASHGAHIVSIATDEEGLVTTALPAGPTKLVVVTPGNQFPSGVLMSVRRRQELIEYAAASNCWIFEDDYDGEFRFESSPVPAMVSLAPASRVIYAGTFSKVLFPSLRLGYLVLPPQLKRDYLNAKYLMDMGNPAVEQAAMARYMSSGRFEQHLGRVVRLAKLRRTALLEGLAKHDEGQLVWTAGSAGTYIIAWMPALSHAQCARFIDYAMSRGLALYPIAPHYRTAPPCPGLLMGYAAMSPVEIDAATRLLGNCLRSAVNTGMISAR